MGGGKGGKGGKRRGIRRVVKGEEINGEPREGR